MKLRSTAAKESEREPSEEMEQVKLSTIERHRIGGSLTMREPVEAKCLSRDGGDGGTGIALVQVMEHMVATNSSRET